MTREASTSARRFQILSLNNWSITSKLFTAPIFLMLGLAVCASLGYWSNARQTATLEGIVARDVGKMQAATDLIDQISRANSQVYQVLAWSGAGVEEDRVNEIAQSIAQQVAILADSVAEMRQTFVLTAAEEELFVGIDESLTQYRKETAGVLDMVTVDVATAVAIMTSANRIFETLSEGLATLAQLERDTVETTYHASAANARQITTIFLAVAGVALFLGALVAWQVGQRIARPVRSMTACMSKLPEGDRTVEVPGLGRADEIGSMAGAVEVFRQNAIENARLAAEEKTFIEQQERRREVVDALTSGFEESVTSMLTGFAESADGVSRAVGVMQDNAAENQALSTEVAEVSERASGSVDTVAEAVRQFSLSISEISQQVERATEVSRKAVAGTETSAAAVRDLVGLGESIGAVVKIITDCSPSAPLRQFPSFG